MKKICSKCGKNQNIAHFYKRNDTRDGLRKECIPCAKIRGRKWYKAHSKKVKAAVKKWAQDNPVKRAASRRKWQEANTEKHNVKNMKWRAANPAHVRLYSAKHRAKRLRRIPKWLTKEDLAAIKKFYKDCPAGYHVDHKIPLCGKNVSGLEVLENLQYLSAEENLRKSNKFNIEKYNNLINNWENK